MKLSSTTLGVFLTILPAVWSLPNDLSIRQYKLPTCAADTCLTATSGTFDECPPSDIACLCRLDQAEVTRYAATVQSCIDGEKGKEACTDGAREQYKDVLKTVCASEQFGSKTVEWAPTTSV